MTALKLTWALGSCVLHASAGLAVGFYAHAPRGGNAALQPQTQIEIELLEAPASIPLPALPAPLHNHRYAVPENHDQRVHSPTLLHARQVTPPPAASASSAAVMTRQAAAPLVPEPIMAAADVLPQTLASAEIPATERPRFNLGARLSKESATQPPAGAGSPAAAAATPALFSDTQVSKKAQLLARAPLAYPAQARAIGQEARVVLEIIVDASGAVTAAEARSASGFGFESAALAAVRGYRFVPAEHAGKKVAVRMRWVVEFSLN